MKGLAKFFLQNRALSWLLLVLILGGGIFSYYNMGKLEDAPFTIKQAVVTTSLPAGAGPSVVNDDFGDVLGVFYGLSSETHTYRELENQAKRIKNELLNVKDVAKVELFGVQSRTIDITVNPALLSSTGVTMADIASAFERQNKVVDAGGLETSSHRLRVEASGSFSSLEELENLTVVSRQGEYFRLGEIADISESYVRPARNLMKVGNVPAVGIAISTVSDGNVVEMAELVANRVSDLREEMPDGYNLDIIYDQGHESAVANEGFVWNLILSVLTVVAVLLFFIGFKNGILIGSGLIFSIFGTLIYMQFSGIALQRMSLAAIIIAMGMLVDNAIVVYDAALVNMQRGMRKRKAILDAVSGTSMPLLGATLIAVLTFLPVYLSPHITGEILSSLFIVIAVSLLLSWVLAITQNVFFVQEFVRRPRPDELKGELFSGRAYDLFRQALRWTIQRRYVVLGAMVLLLVIAGWGFRFIPQQFMPLLNKQYFSVDVWLPEGTRIEESDRQMTEMTAYLNSLEGVKKVSSFVGQTPPRYYLANAAYGPQPNYAQCLVEADTPEKSRELQAMLYDRLPAMFPDALVRVNSFEINSIPQALIEARFCGDDPEVLDSLTNLALEIMRKNPKVLNARNEWGSMALMIKADYDPVKAGRLNVGRHDMMNAVKAVNDGTAVGVYRDRDKKVPVLLHTDVKGSWDMESVEDLPIWNGRNSAPLGQVANGIGLAWEYPLVRTYDRKLSMAALTKYFPLALIMLLVILVMLFGNFRQPLIIFLILPLSLIGMVFGLWVTGFQFGFFCIAGWLGLLGMIIKNVIVLLDEVNIQQKAGVEPYTAVIEATVSRARPVLMAALTTVFGSIPLLFDIVFGGMAATIVFGLSFATLLTLFVTPALYTVFYKISKRGE